jgi:hypothetical protein
VGKVDLEALHLDFCDVQDDAVSVLGEFENLASLALRHTQVTDSGLRPLGRLTKLEILWLDQSHVRGDGLAHLAKLPLLEELSLHGCQIQDDALRHLANLPHLRELDLRSTQVTGRGLRYLDRANALEQINLEDAPLDDAGFMSAASLPWNIKLNLGETQTLTLPGIIQMHAERARLRALPVGMALASDDSDVPPSVEFDDEPHGFVEPYEQWLEDAGESDDDEEANLVDAEMEVDHNTIVWYQYGIADKLIDAYRQKVLGEPPPNDEEDGGATVDPPDDQVF